MGRSALAILLTLLSIITASVAYSQETYSITSLEMTVFRDGLVRFTHEFAVNETIPTITFTILATPVENVFIVDQDGHPVSFELEQKSMTVNTLGATKVKVEYDSATMTREEGNLLTVDLTTPQEIKVKLPEQAVLISISDPPLALTSEGNRPVLHLEKGSWEIRYTLPLERQPTTLTPTPHISPPSTTNQPPSTLPPRITTSPVNTSTRHPSTLTNDSAPSRNPTLDSLNRTNLLGVSVTVVLAIVAVAVLITIWRKKPNQPKE